MEKPFLIDFLKNNGDVPVEDQYHSKCNLSMAVNYLLYVIFITTTIAYIYFTIRLSESKNTCFADILSDEPMSPTIGRDIKANFVWDFYIGSICGIIEIIRNTLHLWAKCFQRRRAALIFQVLSFITAFLFCFNFVNL